MLSQSQTQKNFPKSYLSFAEEVILKRNSKTKLTMLIWIIVFVGTLTGFMLTLKSLVTRYNKQPVTNVILGRAGDFAWPDITICPSGRFDEDVFRYTLNKETKFDWETEFRLRSTFWKFVDESKYNKTYIVHDYNNWAILNSFLNRHTSNQTFAFKKSHNVIVLCLFQGKGCDFLNFTTLSHPTAFNCFVFRPNNRAPGVPGRNNGLKLLLHTGASNEGFVEASSRLDRFRGFQVTIHPPGSLPNFNRNSMELSNGMRLDLEVTAKQIKRYNRSTNYCYNPKTVNKSNALFVSSFVECQDEISQKQFQKICGCQSPDYYPVDVNASSEQEFHERYDSCLEAANLVVDSLLSDVKEIKKNITDNSLQTSTILNLMQNFFTNNSNINISLRRFECFLGLKETIADALFKFKCPSYCDEMEYQVYSSSSVWPIHSPNVKNDVIFGYTKNLELVKSNEINSDLLEYYLAQFQKLFKNRNKKAKKKQDNYVQRRFSLLSVYMSSSKVDVLCEEEAYPWTNLISDIGGNMGMWIGMSFITIVNILEVIIGMTYQFYLHKNEIHAKEDDDSEFGDQKSTISTITTIQYLKPPLNFVAPTESLIIETIK